MKYTILSPYPRISRIVDTPNSRTVKISDELAVEAQEVVASGKKPFLFNGKITTFELERENGNQILWNEDTNCYELVAISMPVPESISAWQAHAALKITPHDDGTLYDAVVQALHAMPEGDQKTIILTAWEKDANFIRTSPTILAIANSLGLTDTQLDNIFILADSLKV